LSARAHRVPRSCRTSPSCPTIGFPSSPKRTRNSRTIAPDIAIEILSPDDQGRHVQEKIDLYRSYGKPRVVVVDPQTESLTIYEQYREPRTFRPPETAPIVDDLRIDLGELFSPEE
jgi:Uma2 family endonuclease